MRTTVEITEKQHRRLMALAADRGIRGFSPLVQEAIERYLADLDSARVDLALALEGVIGDEEAEEVERRITEAWSTWPQVS